MDEQALYALTVGDGKTLQDYILAYFEQLKNDNKGLELCSEALAKNLYSDEKIKFFLLQVIEHHVKMRYSLLSSEQIQTMKICLMEWFSLCCKEEQKTFIKNKTAQIFCLLFVQEYPNKWLSFFKDIMGLLGSGEKAVEMYLRISLAIDEEVVARHIPHLPQEMERNTNIKDTMRVHCVPELVDSWYKVLDLYERGNPELVCLCLEVIGAYVSWIDIDLIANDRFINKILLYLKSEMLRESACDCFFEIISKGMEPTGKTRLVESLTSALENAGILTPAEDEDTDFVVKVAKLINGIGIQLISCWSKLPKLNGEINQSTTIFKAIETKIPYLLRYLSHEDDDISETVSEFAHAYLGLLKQMKYLPKEHLDHLRELLCIVIKKMKYDDDYNFEHEGEDEVMFLEFRKQMKVLLHNIGKIDGNLVVKTLHEYVRTVLQKLECTSLMETEVSIYLVYILAEAVPGQELYNDADKFAALQDMLSMLITSKWLSWVQHVAIRLQFFETITRYERFFYAQTQHIPTVLEAFVDKRGLRDSSPKICSRTSYLLVRFVKTLKTQIQPYANDLLTRIGDLLVSGKDDSYKQKSQLTSDDLNYLYELSGILITCSGADSQVQHEMMSCLLSPIIARFTNILAQIGTLQCDELTLLNSAEELQSLIAFTSRASKAFSSQASLKSSGCSSCFKEALPIFLQSLTVPYHRDVIHAGVRQYLHRMIICLGDELLPFLPVAVTHLLKDCELRDIQEFIPLINQLIARFKGQIAPFLCEVFLPVVHTIFAILNGPMDGTDMQAVKERQTLRRSYFLFLGTIVNNDVVQVITSLGAEDIKSILFTVVQGAADVSDPQGQKNCFGILGKLTDLWGNNSEWTDFKEFIYDSIIPACLLTPLKPVFDLNDGQSFLVLQEISQTLKTILKTRGAEFTQYLQNTYLMQLECPPSAISEYCKALQNMEVKTLKLFLKDFYSKWRTQQTFSGR